MNTKTDISAAYVGGTGVGKLYLGTEVVWPTTPPAPVPYDEQYLTFKITSPGTIRFGKVASNMSRRNEAPTVTIYYKVNSGDWTAITSSSAGTEFNVVSGDTVQFKGDNPRYGQVNMAGLVPAANSFSGSTASFNIQGNIMSLIDSQNFATIDQSWVVADHNSAFYYLFKKTHVVNASNLVLQPSGATTDLLAESIYAYTFEDCNDLIATPELPETDSVPGCCYMYMFSNCDSLTQAPVLPATAVSNYSYCGMFYNCDGLTTAPALPATTLASNCYQTMFWGCTSLITAPELPATTLASNCYSNMFRGCTSLNTITCLATNPSTAYTRNWTTNVASTGTFYRESSATGWTRGSSGIPSGWTVQTYVDPSTPVLKIAGQSIPGTRNTDGYYEWGDLGQYSGTSFTIEANSVPITADTWDYSETYIDECGESSEISHDSGTTMSVFGVQSGYIDAASYDPNNNSVEYSSLDDQTSDDPETICGCQGGCWDGETCQGCEPEDPCDDWEGAGYSSYEECNCAEHGVDCEGEGDPCDDYEGAGYGSYEECTCAERGENCPEEESGE